MRNTVLVLVSIVFALILSEGLLRVIGFGPWQYNISSNSSILRVPDSVLGWRNKKGKYVIPPNHLSGKPIHLTILENGERLSGQHSTSTEGEIVIVGGSFTEGEAVDDSETYAWKLQEKFPSLKVVNYGTGGYGSYQSLLVLEQELKRMTSPKFVIYGFIIHHEVRNVAKHDWLFTISEINKSGQVRVPFATLDKNNRIVRNLPEGYLSLPFGESSALIHTIESAYMKIKTFKRSSNKQKRMVAEEILLQMDKVSKEYGATLFVIKIDSGYGAVNKETETSNHYKDFLKKNNIHFIDVGQPLTDELKAPDRVHPNGKFHTIITERISSVLNDQIEKNNSPN